MSVREIFKHYRLLAISGLTTLAGSMLWLFWEEFTKQTEELAKQNMPAFVSEFLSGVSWILYQAQQWLSNSTFTWILGFSVGCVVTRFYMLKIIQKNYIRKESFTNIEKEQRIYHQKSESFVHSATEIIRVKSRLLNFAREWNNYVPGRRVEVLAEINAVFLLLRKVGIFIPQLDDAFVREQEPENPTIGRIINYLSELYPLAKKGLYDEAVLKSEKFKEELKLTYDMSGDYALKPNSQKPPNAS